MDAYSKLTTPDNLIQRIEDLEATVRALQLRNTDADTLSEIVDDVGVIRGGQIIVGDGDPLASDGAFTGVALLNPGIDDGTGTTYELVAMNAGVLEVGIDNTGKLKAGAGAVTLDRYGVLIDMPPSYSVENSLNWVDGNNNNIIGIVGINMPGSLKQLLLQSALQDSAPVEDANITLSVQCGSRGGAVILKASPFPLDTDFTVSTDVIRLVATKYVAITSSLSINGDPDTAHIYSSAYTPTLYNTTNIAASTAFSCVYSRVGDLVTVAGQVNIDATAAAATVLGMSLPIASNFSATNQLGGVASTAAGETARILADSTNKRATFAFTAVALANTIWSFSFSYRVV